MKYRVELVLTVEAANRREAAEAGRVAKKLIMSFADDARLSCPDAVIGRVSKVKLGAVEPAGEL